MSVTPQAKRRAILAFVQNRQGVLNKISMLIRRKMYNVETITACRTHLRPEISRITITLREDKDEKVRQVIKQIEKITEVISAKELDTDQSFWREVAMVKMEGEEGLLKRLGETFHFDILHHRNRRRYIIQISGTTKTIDDFLQAIGRERIVEVARSGFTAIEK